MGQLPLDLGFRPHYGIDDFFVAPSNEDAHATLLRWPDWPSRTLLVMGPEGSGKTHLASIWAEQAGARSVTPWDLARSTPDAVAARPVLIEDGDRAGFDEAALFHALNAMRERGTFGVLTARIPPDRWGLATPDLVSRLRLAPLVSLAAPDDDLLRAVLVKLFHDRQLVVDEAVIGFLTLRMERSLGAARTLVDALDRASLADHRRITRATAAETLAMLAD